MASHYIQIIGKKVQLFIYSLVILFCIL